MLRQIFCVQVETVIHSFDACQIQLLGKDGSPHMRSTHNGKPYKKYGNLFAQIPEFHDEGE